MKRQIATLYSQLIKNEHVPIFLPLVLARLIRFLHWPMWWTVSSYCCDEPGWRFTANYDEEAIIRAGFPRQNVRIVWDSQQATVQVCADKHTADMAFDVIQHP